MQPKTCVFTAFVKLSVAWSMLVADLLQNMAEL